MRPLTALLAATLLTACADAPAPGSGPGGHVAISVAPLSLPGLTDASYRLRVVNAATQVVWDRDVTSSSYGDGGGAISYVGTCDADSSPNTVELELISLSTATGDLTAGVDYMNPAPLGTPLSLTAACSPDADVPVAFDLTVARAAQQGFFDVAVTFDDIFCSAKFDCQDEAGQPLQLLHDAGGDRAPTAVFAFACTAGDGADTRLYLSDLDVTCADGTLHLDPTLGPGKLSNDPASGLPTSHLFDALVARGAEQLGTWHKVYWNVALGLTDVAGCTLTATGTASDGLFAEGATPAGGTWPVLTWAAPFGGCTRHQLDSGDGVVETQYARPPGTSFPHTFDGTDAHGFTVMMAGSFAPNLPGHYADDSYAASCAAYRAPGAGYEAATASGVYTIDPDGTGGAPAYDVYCDMTTDGGGWTRVMQVVSSDPVTTTASVSPSQLLDGSATIHAKLSDAAIRGLARAGSREFLIYQSADLSTYIMRASDTEWANYSTTGWTNTTVDAKEASGVWHVDVCNGHVNNRGFSTWDDDPYQICQVVYAGTPRYMTPYHSTAGTSVGAPFIVSVR